MPLLRCSCRNCSAVIPSISCRFASVQGGGDQLHADRGAVWDAEGNEQKAARRGDVCQLGEEAARRGGEMGTADLPAPAVEARLKAQSPYHFPRGFFRVGVADVHELAEVVAADGVDHGAYHALGLALGIQVLGDVLVFGDQSEVVVEDAGEERDLVVWQMRLAGMQRAPGRRTVALVSDAQGAVDTQVLIAAEEGV